MLFSWSRNLNVLEDVNRLTTTSVRGKAAVGGERSFQPRGGKTGVLGRQFDDRGAYFPAGAAAPEVLISHTAFQAPLAWGL